jgi:pimeloyl-ACP methyl ester carboxylesterase
MNAERKYAHTEEHPVIAWQRMGEGPVLMLVHGFPENGGLWSAVAPGLGEHFTLIIPDLPGAGESRFGGPVLTMEAMAAQLAEVLRREAVEEAVIAGHSMGGYTALAFTDIYPEMVKGLALIHSGAYADNDEKKETRRKSIALIQKGGKEIFVRQMIPNLFSEKFKKENPAILEKQISRALQLEDQAMIAFYEAMLARPDRTHVLRRGHLPVQWVIGQDDKTTPPTPALQQASLSDISFIELYEDCAHMSMLEQPERLAEDLVKFGLYCNNR